MISTLPHLPERTKKPRKTGITMVMDKGLSMREAEDMVESAGEFIDYVKFGFGSSLLTKNLSGKIQLYKNAGIQPYFGGTLFESFLIRNMFNDFLRFIDEHEIETVEISDGSIIIDHKKKCHYIRQLAKKYTVFSEVGSKEEGIIIHPAMWISMMNSEIEAGSLKVIAESRESGTVGIYRSSGHTHTLLVNKILAKVSPEHVIWEAPQKNQQVWWLKHLGANVNLGNIAPEDALPLETLRLGLRGDTFFTFLPKNISKKV